VRLALTLGAVAALALAGCNASGEASGTRTFAPRRVPFSFQVPTDFTGASIDQGATRGDVVAAAGLTKVDVIAVRRVGAGTALPKGPVVHDVLGQRVTSVLHPVRTGWAIECQYTPARAKKVLAACRDALRTLRRG
jgi:hypothetical protein